MKKNVHMRSSMGNSRLQKKIKDFWINGSCMHYRYHKIKTVGSRKDVHVPRLCAKSHWWYIPHVKSMQKTDRIKP